MDVVSGKAAEVELSFEASILNYRHGWQGSAISSLNYCSSSARTRAQEQVQQTQWLPDH